MSAKMDLSYGPLSREDIARFEARIAVSPPERYVAFLLVSNGGKPTPGAFDVPRWEGESTAIQRFFGIHEGPVSNLEKKIAAYKDRLPEGFIPIASDPGGNLLCLSIRGERREKLYFWDHEGELDDDGRSRMDMSNMFVVADNIGEFMNRLH